MMLFRIVTPDVTPIIEEKRSQEIRNGIKSHHAAQFLSHFILSRDERGVFMFDVHFRGEGEMGENGMEAGWKLRPGSQKKRSVSSFWCCCVFPFLAVIKDVYSSSFYFPCPLTSGRFY
jgi:hypothetical protein